MTQWDKALEQCNEILDLIKEDVPDHAWDAAPDFFEGIQEKIEGMSEWIEEKEHITPKMSDSLDNMERGIRKWIKD